MGWQVWRQRGLWKRTAGAATGTVPSDCYGVSGRLRDVEGTINFSGCFSARLYVTAATWPGMLTLTVAGTAANAAAVPTTIVTVRNVAGSRYTTFRV